MWERALPQIRLKPTQDGADTVYRGAQVLTSGLTRGPGPSLRRGHPRAGGAPPGLTRAGASAGRPGPGGRARRAEMRPGGRPRVGSRHG